MIGQLYTNVSSSISSNNLPTKTSSSKLSKSASELSNIIDKRFERFAKIPELCKEIEGAFQKR
jgi:hypothetical protein